MIHQKIDILTSLKMDEPFEIVFEVEEINNPSSYFSHLLGKNSCRVTFRHTIGDIKQLIWRNSGEFSLKPIFLTIKYMGRKLYDSEIIGSVINGDVLLLENNTRDFKLIIDYELFNSPSIPKADPIAEYFDINIYYGENKFMMRESLGTELRTLKEATLNKYKNIGTNLECIILKYDKTGEELHNNDLKLSDVLKLDVTPLSPVNFHALHSIPRSITDFSIKLNSLKPSILPQNAIFDVNQYTRLLDLKSEIFERLNNERQQPINSKHINLYYESHLLPNTPENDGKHLYELLLLNDNILKEENCLIHITLDINANASSESDFHGGRAPLSVSSNIIPGLPRAPSSNHSDITPVQGTRIVLQNGNRWELHGEAFEMIDQVANIEDDGTPNKLLINQSDLSSVQYVFSTVQPGSQKEIFVSLNSSQCIIAEEGSNEPYVLLSPSGMAKLNNAIRMPNGEPLIQSVRLIRNNDWGHRSNITNEQDMNASRNASNGNPNGSVEILREEAGNLRQNAHLRRNLFAGILQRVLQFLRASLRTSLRYLALFYFTRSHVIIIFFWKVILLYSLIFSILYVTLVGGARAASFIERLVSPGAANGHLSTYQRLLLRLARILRTSSDSFQEFLGSVSLQIIQICVDRPRDHVYVVDDKFVTENIMHILTSSFSNFWKDILLMILTIIPLMRERVSLELEKWRSEDLAVLLQDLRLYYESVLDRVIQKDQVSRERAENNVTNYVGVNCTTFCERKNSPLSSYEEDENKYSHAIEIFLKLRALRKALVSSEHLRVFLSPEVLQSATEENNNM